MQALAKFENALLAQRGHLFCWTPVFLGIGIGGYFSLSNEPDQLVFVALLAPIGLLLILSRVVRVSVAPLLIGICLIGIGFCAAKYRTEALSGPILGFRYYGPIEGRIVDIDRSGSDAIRLTLDTVVLARMAPDRTPNHIRVSLHNDAAEPAFTPGDIVMTTGHLSPPAGPAEPGGFDFQRHAWYLEIGGVGYTRNPVLRLEAVTFGEIDLWIFTQRMALSRAVRAQVAGEAGAFAAAIIAGDRSALSQTTIKNLRATNLAHLLAISGLHMGLLTGFVFAVVRFGLALIPWIALRISSKKIAAVLALLVGAAYLALSGGGVATERAYIMVAVMLVAVLLDRRALTLRAVAMAATVILIVEPEALIGAGFQMSFAATSALVLVFGQMRHFDLQRLPGWARAVLSVVLSSGIAGIATAPFAAAHFNQFAHFGLVANLLSVPLMGVLVMPAAVLAVCLAPLGFWSAGLWIMEIGLKWILYVAERIASIDGGVGYIVAPHNTVLPAFALGFLWLALWQGRARFGGVGVAAIALLIWSQSTRPQILVADSGGLIGVMGDDGRALSKAKGNGFVAEVWLQNDGNPVLQSEAAARTGIVQIDKQSRVALNGWNILQVSGKTALSEVQDCEGADVLIVTVEDTAARRCQVFDLNKLRETGSLAMDVDADGNLVITTARDVSGNRPWSGQRDSGPTSVLLAASQDQE